MEPPDDLWEAFDRADDEVVWAWGRKANRTYVHASFVLNQPASQDHGKPARYIVKVFDTAELPPLPPDHEEWVVVTSPGGRSQIKIQVVRESGVVRQLWIQRILPTKVERLLYLDRAGAAKLIELVRALDHIPVEGGETVRIDDEVINDLFTNPDAVQTLYERDPQGFREAIEDDESARDLIALAYRRKQLDRFRMLLSDPDSFASESANLGGGGPERVWQNYLEENPWVLGVSLSGQLLTSWSEDRLEQVVAGFSVAGSGKRTDALMRTAGRIHSMVFAEVKHHNTSLLGVEYRPDCWAPSRDLAGGVTQIQQTVYQATRQIGERLSDKDEAGADTGNYTYLIRPRSFLIIGSLGELHGTGGGIHQSKHRSFELYRRNLYEPEVITFDELLARAEWHVISAEQDAAQE